MKRLTLHDQKTWGPCPICTAKHGTPCSHRTRTGATHYLRVMRAPRAVSAWQWRKGRVIAAFNRIFSGRPGEAA